MTATKGQLKGVLETTMHERDVARAERDAAIRERDEVRRALDTMTPQFQDAAHTLCVREGQLNEAFDLLQHALRIGKRLQSGERGGCVMGSVSISTDEIAAFLSRLDAGKGVRS